MARTLKKAIDSGRFIVTGELGPALGASPDLVRKKAEHFRGVDAVNVTDNQTGIVRQSSIAAAKLLLDEGLAALSAQYHQLFHVLEGSSVHPTTLLTRASIVSRNPGTTLVGRVPVE